MRWIAEIDGLEFTLEILDEHHVRFGEQILEVDLAAVSGEPLYSLIVDGESYEGYVYPAEDRWQVLLRGQFYPVRVEDEREKRLQQGAAGPPGGGEISLRAPMPGLVIDVPVEEGQAVEKGQVLLVLESMKMQNELRAQRAGRVGRLRVKPGDTVEQRQALMTLQ
jgi:biotin carboxyl carrier protein